MPATRVVRVLVVAAGAGVGLVAVGAAYDLADPVLWLPDLVTGIALATVAAIAWPARPATAWLASAATLAWFAGTVLPFGLYWHRALIVNLLLAFPLAWPRRTVLRVGVVAVYAASATPYVWSTPSLAFGLALALIAVAVVGVVRAATSSARTSHVGLWSTAAYATAICTTSVLEWIVPAGRAAIAGYVVYCAVIVAISVALMRAMRGPDRAMVSDLVVQIASDESPVDAQRLGAALGDPTVRIGYWRADERRYADAVGRVEPSADQAATRVDEDGRPLALITHDRALSADPVLMETAAQAVQWTAANRRLQDEVEAHIADIRASRRRLLVAADDELVALRRQLGDQVIRPLHVVSEAIGRFKRQAPDAASTPAAHALSLLEHALEELEEISQGLAPRELDEGLEAALTERARRATIPVTVALAPAVLPRDIEVAVYYVCSEAITNATRYAPGARMSIDVSAVGGEVLLVIGDDGPGGADATLGSGLNGLAGRVDALGGSLSIRSPRGGGTTITVRLPVHE